MMVDPSLILSVLSMSLHRQQAIKATQQEFAWKIHGAAFLP
jgi:hypothetical protein